MCDCSSCDDQYLNRLFREKYRKKKPPKKKKPRRKRTQKYTPAMARSQKSYRERNAEKYKKLWAAAWERRKNSERTLF